MAKTILGWLLLLKLDVYVAYAPCQIKTCFGELFRDKKSDVEMIDAFQLQFSLVLTAHRHALTKKEETTIICYHR